MNAIERLIDQHRTCDAHLVDCESAVRAGQWQPALSHWQAFETAMLAHFTLEETQLFPAFEDATGMRMGPTVVMRSEHEEMRALLTDVQAALSQQDAAAFLGHGETLLILMQQHNMKEENVLYPMCGQHVAGLESMVAEP
ncbi:hemerythrin domain-containing protein [Paludibacterium sp. THUN1379]|uniref:hemerythrin domain-containing protein n=1 Tax=Paludibacterium sp. THUN1379 TaxID=3112107 RepID=UPI00308B43D5|nr:hemerythrin domain-containing protein [Paludibacterium sp. THUN1379]